MTSNGPEDFAHTEEFTSEFVPTSNETPDAPPRPKFSWEEEGPSSIVTTTSTIPGTTAPKPSPAEPVSETAKKFEDSGKIDALALRKALIDHEEQRSSYQKSIDGWLGKTGLLNPDEAAKAAQAERETAIASQSRWTEAKKWYDEQRKSGAANAVDLGAIGNAIADYNPLALVSNATVDFVGTKLGRNIEDAKKRQAEADAIIEGKKDPFVQEIWRNTFENSAKGVVNSLASSTIKSVGYGYGFAKQAIGLTSDATDNSVYATGAAIEKWAEKTFPTDPARKEEWSSVVGQGAGSMLGLLTPAIGAKVVAQFGPRILYSATKGSMGLPALAEGATLAERTIEASRLAASGNIWAGRTVGITGAMTTSAEMSDEYVKHQKAKGEPVDPRKLVGLYAMGLGIGYTERLSIDAVLNRHGGSILAAGLVQMVEEGGQEFASQIMQNVAAIGMYDDKRHWDDNAWTGAAVGAILGGAMGGSSALMGKMGNKWDGDPEAPQVTTGDVNAKMKTVAPAAAIPAVPMASAPAKPDPLQPVAPGASPAPAVAAPITTGMDPAVLEELRQIDPEFAAEAERIAKVSTGTKTDVSPAATSEVPPTQPQDAPAIQPMLDGPSQPGEAGRTSVTTRTTGAPSIPDEIMAILRQTNPEMARKYESTPEQPNVNISTSELMFGRQPGNEGSPEKLVQTLSKFSALDLFRVAEANGLQVTEDGRPLAQLPANELVDGIVSATAAKMRSRSAVVSRGGLVQESIPAAVQVDEPQEETVVRLEDELPAIAADIEQFMVYSGINDVLTDPEFREAAQQVLDGIDLAAAVAGTIAARSQTASQAAPELSANIPAQNAENADAQVEPAVRGYPQFVEMLAGKTPASKWASEMGVDQASLDGLIQQALLDGRLSMVGGKPRRTPKAKVLPDAPLQDAPQAVVKESRTTEAPAAPRPTLTRAEEKRLEAVKDELAYTHAKRLLDTQSDAGQFADALKTLRSDKKLTKAKMAEVFKAYTGSRKAPPKTKPKAIEALKTVRDQRAKKMATAPIAQPVIPVARPVETISITTPYGDMEIAGQVEIVDISTLKKATGSLQPRDRSRAESQETIRAIASKLDPAQLMPSRVSDSGAPIVAADGTVISGNGRVEAIRQVYANADLASRAQAYREAIGDAGGIAQPVKIVRLPAMSRAELERFADLSNRSRISSMSATERAQRDAKAVGSDILGLYVGGPFTTVQNQDFYRAFVAKIPANERGAFSRDGVLSKEGEDRMSAAILAAAYGDPQMLSRMLEDTDDNIKSITGAMRDSAGAFIRQKAAIASGQASPKFDITPQVSEVAKRIADLRDRGITPREFLAQMDAFTTVDPIVESLLVAFYNEKMSRQLSREKLTEILTRYANEATKHADGGLFEDTTKPKDIIGIARSRALEGERLALEQTDIFSASQGAALRGNAGDRGTGSGSGVDGRGQGSSQGQNPQALIEENTKPLDQITLPIDPAASNEQKLAQVARLTAENKPILDAQLKELDAELGTESNANTKKDATILEKASRPSILAKKPWHGVEHIRDTLRFQTKIDQFSQIETAVSKMLANGYSIVKVDTEKMLAPKEWGWRFAGLDLRAPNGQLIEWYLIFRSMYAAKKEGHKIFEKWRNETPQTIEGRKEEYFQDIQRSFALYQGAFEDGLRASGYAGLEDAKADIAKLSASLPKTAAKLAAISSGTGGVNSDVQGASGPGLNTPMGPDSTRQRPVSSSSNTSGGLSGTGASFAFQSAQRPKIHVVKPISGQFSHDIETDAIESAYKAIGAGNTVVVTPSVVNRTLDVLRDMSASAPAGVGVGTIAKIRPMGGDAVKVVIRLTDGRDVAIALSARALLGAQSARGFSVGLPSGLVPENDLRSLVVVTNYTDNLVVGSQLARIAGTYVHETVHALRKLGLIPDVVWQRFVNHAYASGALELSFQRLQEANGGSPTNDKSSIGAFYTDFYERQPGATDEIVQERLDQEAAAHFAELATHGFWDADTLAPVQDILDGIESGAFSRVAQERELEDAEFAFNADTTLSERINQALGENTDGNPVRTERRLAGLDDQGSLVDGTSESAAEGRSQATDVPGSSETSLEDGSEGRDGVRTLDWDWKSQVEAVKGRGWMDPESIAQRQRMQGYNVKGWHGTTRDFEIPDPNRGIFGYHVSIGTPRASNLRLGFGDNALERAILKSAPKAADAQIQPVMVRAESQLRLPHFDWDDPKSWIKAVKAKRYAGSAEFRGYILANEASMPTERGEAFRQWIINALETSGHDSIIYKSRYEDAGRDSLFVWDARNVRSQLDLFDERAENDAGLTASRQYLENDLSDLINGLIEETVDTLPRGRMGMTTDQAFQAMLDPVAAPMFAMGGRRDLDMSPEARKARAQEMGFDTSKVWYHVTDAEFDQFSNDVLGGNTARTADSEAALESARLGTWFTTEPERVADMTVSDIEGGRTIPAYVRGNFYDKDGTIDLEYVIDVLQKRLDKRGEGAAERWRNDLIKKGYDGIRVIDTEFGGESLIVFDPKNIRSVNAMFDPEKSDSPNIMYAFNGRRTSTEAERAALADKFDEKFAGQSAPALNKIITDLKQSLGIVTTQGLWGMTVKQSTPNADGTTTVREKRLRPSSRMRGMFRPKTGAISVRMSRDISVIAHEGGHALEMKLGDDLAALKEAHRAVLEAQAYPGAQDKLSEGFAEWFKAYIVDSEHAKTVAPEFADAFEDLIDGEMPGALAQLIEVQSAYAAHIKLSPLQSLSADLVSTYENNTWAELNEPGLAESIPGRLSTAYTATIDALHPLNMMVKRLLEVADDNGVRDQDGKPISVKTHENPYKLSRLFADSYSRGRMWLENGIADYGSTVIKSRSLHDAMNTLFKGEKWDKQTYKDFGAYLISRRAVAEYDLLAQKQAALAKIDTTLDAVGKARPMVADRAAKDAAIAERRQAAVIREQTLLQDRRRQLSSARTQMQNLQVRLSDLMDDRDLGQALANQTETASDMAARRNRSISIASRDAARLSREIEALELEVDEREVGVSMISNEAEQAQEAATASRQRVEQLDALTARLRKERAQRADLGASRPPTMQPREFHEKIIAEVEAKTPHFADASKIVYEWTHQLLKVRRQAGFLTQEQFDVLAQRKDWYVPFHRDMSDIAPEAVFTGETGPKKWSPFKKFDGSDRAIVNPLEVLSQQSYTTAQQIAFNDIIVSMSNLANRVGAGSGQILETLTQATSAEANSATFDKIKNTAIALGIDPVDAHLIVQSMEQNFSDADVQMIWSPENKGPMALPTLPMWRNGERILVRMPDPEFGKMVFDAVNGMGKEARNILDRVGGGFSTALRVGVTTHPDFILGNLLRDIPAMFIISGAIPGVAHAKGLYHYVKNTETARLYNEAGGIMGGANVAATRKSDSRVDVLSLKNKGFTFELRKFWHVIEAVETAGRMGVFAHALKQAKIHDPSLTPMQAAQEAAYVARDVIDFGRRGSKSAAMMRVVTFMNAHIQGMDKAQRLFKADSDRGSVMAKQIGLVLKRESGAPLSRNEERALADAYKALIRLSLFTAFSLALIGMMWDDPEYKDIKDQTKNKHNWVKLWGQWTRWPLPFELALPTRYVEIIADKIAGRNEEMAKRLAASTFDALAPPIMPQILNLATGVVANHDNFRGRPIVGEHLQGLDPALRFDAYTSQLSIDMAKAVQATGVPRNWVPSPKMIDFLITSGGAYWGKEAQNIYSGGKKALGMSNREAWQWTDLPVVRRVTGVPAQQSRSIEGFYKLVGSSGGELSSAATSYKNYIDKQGQPEAAAVYLSRLQPEERAYAFLMQHRSADEKRSHPLERLKIADATLRDMRKEMILDTLTDKNRKGKREWDTKVVLSPTKQTEVHGILQKLGALEGWNAMVLMKRPGWEDGKMYDPKPLEAVLKAASPDVYRILEARRAKTKMPDWDQVRRDWPKMREDLLKEAAKPL